MDGGKKIFPQEEIAEALPILRTLQSATVFSRDDVQCVYEFEEIDKNLFSQVNFTKKGLRFLYQWE